MYICNHCKPIIRKNEVPARCVLNGLKCETNLITTSSQIGSFKISNVMRKKFESTTTILYC